MKCSYEVHELYPDYTVFPDENGSLEFTQEEIEDFKRVTKEYNDWQRKIEKRIK